MQQIFDFVSNNQITIITVVLCMTWLLNKYINKKADEPQEDGWDKIKPYSNALCTIVFDGVEYLAKTKKMTSLAKSIEYLDVLKKFADAWKGDRATALAELYAWYASLKKKSDEITADSVAVEVE